MNTQTLVSGIGVTAGVAIAVALVRPFLESIPGLADTPENKARHDAALQILNILLNVAAVFLLTAAYTDIQAADVFPLIVQALAQAAGAHLGVAVIANSKKPATAKAAKPAKATAPEAASVDVPASAPSNEVPASAI